MCRLLVLAIVLVHLVNCQDKENDIEESTPLVYEPSWTYECVPDEGCQRSDFPQPTLNRSMIFDSIDLCRTVCGRFGGIWPKPVTAALSMQTIKIHPNYLRFDLSNAPAETRKILAEMSQVATQNIISECEGNVTEVVEMPVIVHITVKTDNMNLTWQTDEQYRLDVQSKDTSVVVQVIAETVFGARHGLETLTHLISADKPDLSEQSKCGLRMVAGAKIWDKPVYPHRGFLLDTSRNFIPMDDIKRMIDGLATLKMNVFHWHVTDSHSFPLESRRVPQFTKYGAYSASEIYSSEEVRGLVEYALVRGVRILIEIDSPAHAGNGWQWGNEYGLGDLAVCVNEKPWRQLCIQPPCGQLNPANPAVYRVLRDLYRDIAETLTKPPLFHIGGDEVFFECWNSSNTILEYMQTKGYSRNVEGFINLWSEFHEKALNIWDEELAAIGETEKQPVLIWSSELTQAHRIQKHLDKKRYTIEVWEPLSSPLLIQLIRLGYNVISVPKDVWYLDHGFWGQTKYSNWRRMYAHTLPRDPNVLGGEVAMWTEYVDKEALDPRVFPRVASVAERLWSDPTTGASGAQPRLQRVRTRLVQRGLRADVLAPGWCAQHDTRCL
ncbi:beta-N-acetylglucosaminidase 1 precursor [Danaus plexippus plexippus]|uniref:Beta-hexosaminidase n=2 Tax=Danaus plexippus TaxID=13037 RepID=A0A212EXD1_DANPL|nr:beta-N-acetylglucosaminidase 1 precursor [Danaus plexippus plexippus]